jgi:hypothetical protein
MTNIKPAPSQNSFNDPVMPTVDFNSQPAIKTAVQSPTPDAKAPVANQVHVPKEQININKNRASKTDSNKLWIILLVLIATIIGFWIGYFTNEYFFRNDSNPNNLIGEDGQTAPIVPPTVEPVADPTSEPVEVNKEYIVFKDEENYLNDGLNFISDEQCVEDEIAILKAIGDDYLTIQINEWTLQEDSGEYLAELVDFQVKDQECIAVRPICPNVLIERCFSLENIDGVYHLDYEFREGEMMPQSPDLESEL